MKRADLAWKRPKKARMTSGTDNDDSLRDPIPFPDCHFEKCSPNHIPEWLKSIVESFLPEHPSIMAKRPLENSDSEDDDDSRSQSQSQASSSSQASRKKKRSHADEENEAANVESFNKRYKVHLRTDAEVLGK